MSNVNDDALLRGWSTVSLPRELIIFKKLANCCRGNIDSLFFLTAGFILEGGIEVVKDNVVGEALKIF